MKPEFTDPVFALWNKIYPPNSQLKNLIFPLILIISREIQWFKDFSVQNTILDLWPSFYWYHGRNKDFKMFALCIFWQSNLSQSPSFALSRNLLRSKSVLKMVTHGVVWPSLLGVMYSVFLHAPSYILKCLFTGTILYHQKMPKMPLFSRN